jgi:hypothetical protein
MNYLTFDKDRYHEVNDIQLWCEKHFGSGKWLYEPYPKDWSGLPNWTVHSMFGRTTFAFKDPKHYTLFILNWS